MAANEEMKFELINELTLHIEKLEMDNEIHILREDLNKETYESELKIILNLKNILGKLILDKNLESDDIELVRSELKNKDIIAKIYG